MQKITYGAPRLVDWVARIKAGAATVRIHFTGGALTAYGITPAEYTTTNAFIQRVIESSSYFKEGRIKLLRKTETEDPETSNAKTQEIRQCKTDGSKAETAATAYSSAERQESSGQGMRVETKSDISSGTSLKEVPVTCLPDAQAYLQDNYNIPSYKVRSCETAQRMAAEHGFRFTGAKFDTHDSAEASEAK